MAMQRRRGVLFRIVIFIVVVLVVFVCFFALAYGVRGNSDAFFAALFNRTLKLGCTLRFHQDRLGGRNATIAGQAIL